MNRVVVTLIGILWSFGFLCAQHSSTDSVPAKKYFFHNMVNKDDLISIDRSMLAEHPFGDIIARKMYLLQDYYTYTEPPTPTSPGEKTVVLKPVIYNTVLKLNRLLKKQVKKGIVDKERATNDLDYCLDVALSVLGDVTTDFEAELRKAKSPDQIIQVFNKVELW
ncbi:MAG: hypothetical protein JW973_17965 [Bacteroidales bacterium]|nr:hypothetical protein [Bacteroidales bacterium]